jgi:hypothetical protein
MGDRMPEARDDTDALLDDIGSGARVAVLIAPAAFRSIPQFGRFLGYLRANGAVSFHEVLPYADISTWLYWRHLRRGTGNRVMVTACAGAMSLAKKGTGDIAIPPIPSPLQCSAIALGRSNSARAVSDVDAFAFISPCAYKWTEFGATGPGGIPVSYNATIRRINSLIADGFIQTGKCSRVQASQAWKPLTVGGYGSVLASLQAVLPDIDGTIVKGAGQVLAAYRSIHRPGHLVEPYACPSGCAQGSAVGPIVRGKNQPRDIPTDPKPASGELLAQFEAFEKIYDPAAFVPSAIPDGQFDVSG